MSLVKRKNINDYRRGGSLCQALLIQNKNSSNIFSCKEVAKEIQ